MNTADDWVQAVRIYVVSVACLTAVVGIPMWRRWRSFLAENQMAWLAVAAFNFSAFFGTLDLLIHHGPGGVRTYVTAIAVTWALFAVSYRPVCQLTRWWRTRRLINQYQPKRLRATDADQRNP